jgi:GDPmannose 4,6-dehydratase
VDIEIEWQGEGINEVGTDKNTNQPIVEVDPQYFRPTEVELLLGDASRAKENLGWKINYSISELVDDMVTKDRQKLRELNPRA